MRRPRVRPSLLLYRGQCPHGSPPVRGGEEGGLEMASISEAVRRGMARGARLAMSPTPQTYRRIRTPQQDSVTQAWALTGRSLRAAMTQRSKPSRRDGA